ncbi:MAG: hypothetical protein MUF38_16815 [Anaerolineae bacterium]|nr:hypothetical protein [Anaerolineae bacterium]
MQSNVAMRSNYGAWHSKIYYETIDMPYRIYMTGWMRNGYYHYIAPLDTNTNHPKRKSEIADGEDIDNVVNVFRNPIPVDADPKNDKNIPDNIVLYDDLKPDSTDDIPDVYDAVLDELGNVLDGGGSVISGGSSVNSDSGSVSGGGDTSDDGNDPVSDDGMSDDEDPVSDGDDGDDGGDDGDDSDYGG